MRHKWRKTAIFLIAASLLALALVYLFPPVAGTVTLIYHLSTPAQEASAAAPEAVDFSAAESAYSADLYRPRDELKGAVVLVPGIHPAGKDEPRLIELAKDLARSGFMVLVPDIPSFRAQRPRPADTHIIAAAVGRLASLAQNAERAVGLVALSYAGGPAVLTALGDHASRRPDYIVIIGGYYDLTAVITFFTTGYYRLPDEREWRHKAPNNYGKWVFVRANADLLPEPADSRTLRAIAERKLRDPAAFIDDLAGQLGDQAMTVLDLVSNRQPGRVPELIARLPRPIRDDIDALDLSNYDLSAVTAEIILVHGRDDRIIPYSESVALARALPAGQVHLFVPGRLAHVDLDPGQIGMTDAFRLVRAGYRIMRAARR